MTEFIFIFSQTALFLNSLHVQLIFFKEDIKNIDDVQFKKIIVHLGAGVLNCQIC